MHDIDRALFEYEQDEGDSGEFETEADDSRELQLAGELLELSDEGELDQFLGKLVSGAVSAGRSFLRSDVGKAVTGVVRNAAKQALPQIGQALGNYVAPGVGGQIGSRLGSFVGDKLGLELEGLSAEDREFEVARAFVRFAEETARTAATAPPSVPATAAARRAAVLAAQRQLPGLVPVVQRPGQGRVPGQGRRRGQAQWYRQENGVVVVKLKGL